MEITIEATVVFLFLAVIYLTVICAFFFRDILFWQKLVQKWEATNEENERTITCLESAVARLKEALLIKEKEQAEIEYPFGDEANEVEQLQRALPRAEWKRLGQLFGALGDCPACQKLSQRFLNDATAAGRCVHSANHLEMWGRHYPLFVEELSLFYQAVDIARHLNAQHPTPDGTAAGWALVDFLRAWNGIHSPGPKS